ncbi:MAG: hypothetical protein H0W78_03160 [Planctomycetes bacterium]|nr:hypothetical protein [Planctomycetota bacterium]
MIPQTLLPDLQQRWSELAQAAMRDGQPLIGSALSGSRPVSFATGTLTIECPADFCDRADADPVLIQHLVTLVAQLTGHRLVIRIRPPAGLDGGRSARYTAAEAHPLVQALRKRFAADIITREPITREEWLKRSGPPRTADSSQPGDDAVPGV